ncbi:MAG TPA: NUDIX hydrolase [Solirubrobacteraceae bacterium]|nr:NUDIX hydrolase [Solirubrobacteraceae bacterium]
MPLPVPLRRLVYRCAYAVLRVLWFLRRPRTRGVKCLLWDEGRVLLVRHTYGSWRWDVPGGGLHGGEAPAIAAHREMQEELGLGGLEWVPLGSVRSHVDHRQDTLHCFVHRGPGGPLTVDRGEIAEVRWFPVDELPSPRAPHVEAIVRLAQLA